jgi:hypothetical protein
LETQHKEGEKKRKRNCCILQHVENQRDRDVEFFYGDRDAEISGREKEKGIERLR